MIAVICVVGRKNVGKTTLIERLIPELVARGRRIATIKHDAHDFEIDIPGKDTWRHRQAGSTTTVIASSSKLALVRQTEREADLDELLRLVDRSYDLVLVEGMRRSSRPKILVHRPELGPPPEFLGELWAVVGHELPSGAEAAPLFAPRATVALADHLEERLLGPPPAAGWNLPALLAEAGRQHGHLCPGQVLGVRMAIVGCDRLGISEPRSSKRLIVFVETDRCGADAIQAVTGCTLGKRTLKFVDYGKLAATFVDTATGRAVRVSAMERAREAASRFAPDAPEHSEAQLRAYKALPSNELFSVEEVRVELREEDLPGPSRGHVVCESCGEGVAAGREVVREQRVLCLACAAPPYYTHDQPVGRSQTRTEPR